MKIKKINIPIYDFPLMFIETENVNDLYKLHESFKGFFDANSQLFASTVNGSIKVKETDLKCIYIILNRKGSFKNLNIGTLAHEAQHVVDYVFEIIGQSLDDSEEPRAYLLEWVMNELCKFVGLDIEIK